MLNKSQMTSENTSIEHAQTDKNVPGYGFQWETPVLYTEDWLKTLGGGITDIIENGLYHT